MKEIKGKLDIVAKTGGIKLEIEGQQTTWINPTKEAKQNILDNLEALKEQVGIMVSVTTNDEGYYSKIDILAEEPPKKAEEGELVHYDEVDEVIEEEPEALKPQANEPQEAPKEAAMPAKVPQIPTKPALKKPVTEIIRSNRSLMTGDDLVPKFEISVEEAKRRMDQLDKFIAGVMVKDQDFGIIPGVKKPSLFKSGAEKLENIHGFYHTFEELERVIPQDPKQMLMYRYKCSVYSKKTGIQQSECIGSTNSYEKQNWRAEPFRNMNTIDKMAQKRAFVGAVLSACRVSAKFTQDVEDFKENFANQPK